MQTQSLCLLEQEVPESSYELLLDVLSAKLQANRHTVSPDP